MKSEFVRLREMLAKGDFSCVIANGTEVRTFTGRGVQDLFLLYVRTPAFLSNAIIADKVVGMGAAALMILGGVASLYARVASTPALAMLRRYGVEVECGTEVGQISNRSRTGTCPVETICRTLETPEEMFSAIKRFLEDTGQIQEH